MTRRLLGYLWASPATLVGLLFILLAWLSGGKARVVRGVIEVHGGLITALLRRGLPVVGPASAMTIGHVILGRDVSCLEHSRNHEHVHVRQFERWGLLLLPLYLGASIFLFVRGRDPYFDNPFEREAFDSEEFPL